MGIESLPLTTRRAHTPNPEPGAAVRELREGLHADPAAIFLFVSPEYPLDALGPVVGAAFSCPVVGCTTAGQLGPGGYESGGITAASVAGGGFSLHPHLIHPLTDLGRALDRLLPAVRTDLAAIGPEENVAGLVLVDGLSRREERLMTSLFAALPGLSLVGGSAGDNLRFQRTHVYHEGRFLEDAATLSLIRTSEFIQPFRFQHYEPTATTLVVTHAEVEERLVREINGLPAASAYARALGVPDDSVGPEHFAAFPLMWRAGNHWFIRSIQRLEPDGSLRFYCAVDRGAVLRVGTPIPMLETLREQVVDLVEGFAALDFLVGFDCIERRLEAEQRGILKDVGGLLDRCGVVGFSTYGEQYNALHINRTLVGLAIGRKHAA